MITYKTSDAAFPDVESHQQTLITQVVNDSGGYGAGFSGALAKRWPQVEKLYYMWHQSGSLGLGQNQYIAVEPGIIVVNMCAQHKWKPHVQKPIRYGALAQCLYYVGEFVRPFGNATRVAMPRIGCGLAGASWEEVEIIILDTLPKDLDVVVYDLP